MQTIALPIADNTFAIVHLFLPSAKSLVVFPGGLGPDFDYTSALQDLVSKNIAAIDVNLMIAVVKDSAGIGMFILDFKVHPTLLVDEVSVGVEIGRAQQE